jgi:hypothetical protein
MGRWYEEEDKKKDIDFMYYQNRFYESMHEFPLYTDIVTDRRLSTDEKFNHCEVLHSWTKKLIDDLYYGLRMESE